MGSYNSNKSNNVSINFGGLGATLLQIAFIVLKFCNIIKWDWIWVLAPLWISVVLFVILLGFIVLIWTKHY